MRLGVQLVELQLTIADRTAAMVIEAATLADRASPRR